MEKLNQYMISIIIRYLWIPTQLQTIYAWRRASKSCFHNFPNSNNSSFWHFVIENLDFIHPDKVCTQSAASTGDSCWWMKTAIRNLGEEKITHLRFISCECCDFQLWKQIHWQKLTHLQEVSNVSGRHRRLFLGGLEIFGPQSTVRLALRYALNDSRLSTEDFMKYFARKLRRHPEKLVMNLQQWIEACYTIGLSTLLPHFRTYFRMEDFFRLSYESFIHMNTSTFSEWKRSSLENTVMELYHLNFHDFVSRLVQERFFKRRLIQRLLAHSKKRELWNQVGIPLYTLFSPMDLVCDHCQDKKVEEEYRVFCIYCYFNGQCSEKQYGDLATMMAELGFPSQDSFQRIMEKWKTSALLLKRLALKKRLETCLLNSDEEKPFQALVEICGKFDFQLKLLVPETEVAAIFNNIYRDCRDTKRYKLLQTFGYNLNPILQSLTFMEDVNHGD